MPGQTPVASLHDPELLLQRLVQQFNRKFVSRDSFVVALADQSRRLVSRYLGPRNDLASAVGARHEICIHDFVLDVITRLDIGLLWKDSLDQNEEWVELAKAYLPNAMAAAIQLSIAITTAAPGLLVVSPFLDCTSSCQKDRTDPAAHHSTTP